MIVRELITLLGFKLNDGPQKQYDRQIDATKAKSNALAGAAKGIGTAYTLAAAAVAAGVGWITKNIIDATLEMEGYRSQIQAFTGDADSAAETLAELRDKTIDPLFGTGNLVNAYKQLRTVGMGADDTSRMIDVLGDVANGSVENFNALNNVLLRAAATGKVNDGTMRQLAQAGFGAADMAQGLGISVGQLNKDLAGGKIGFAELTRAMEGATKEGGRFYMNAANQARTLGGSIKILQDVIGSMGDAIGTKIAPALASVIRYGTNLIKLGSEGLVNFGAKAFETLLKRIADVYIFFAMLRHRLREYGDAFAPLKNIFLDVFGFLEGVIQSAEPFLMNLAVLFVTAFRPVQAFVRPVLEALKPIFQDVFNFAAEMIGKLIPIIDGLTPAFREMGERVSGIINKLRPILQNIERAIIAAFEPIKAFVTPIIEALKPVVEGVFNFINDVLGVAKDRTDGLAGAVRGLTPLFSGLGRFVGSLVRIMGGMLGPILGVAGAIKGVRTAIAIGKGAVGAFNAAVNISHGISGLLSGNLTKMAMSFRAVGMSQDGINRIAERFEFLKGKIRGAGEVFTRIRGNIANVTKALIDNAAAALRAAGAWVANTAKVVAHKVATVALAAAQKTAAAATAAWDWIKMAAGIVKNTAALVANKIATLALAAAQKIAAIAGQAVAVVQGVINAVMMANPVVLIVMGIIAAVAALIAIIVLVVKSWDKVKDVFFAVGNVIKTVFQSIWNVIKAVFSAAWNFIKAVVSGIINIIGGIVNVVKAVFMAVWNIVTGIFSNIVNTIKNIFGGLKAIWQGDGNFFVKLWESVKLIFSQIWQGILANIKTIANAFLGIWEAVKGLFIRIWESVANVFRTLWQGIAGIFTVYVEGIKNIFASIINVFVVIWNKIKGGVMAFVNAVVAIWRKFVNVLKSVIGKLADAVKKIWTAVAGFFSGLWNTIKAAAIRIWNSLFSYIRGLVDRIKQIWQAVSGFFASLWDGIVSVAINVWNAFKDWMTAFVEAVKGVWSAITGFFSGLWDGIVNTAKAIWDTLKSWFSGLVEGIKNIWNGIIDFFSGLWEALKQGPSAAIEFIRNAFFGLFENIQNFFFGFIDKIKQGWDTVKGFFSGIGEGVVNFVTGGGEEPAAARPVNDLIVTPEGRYSTHPDDYVMAMKNPGDLVDSLIRFLGLQQPQPAYAGGSLISSAMSRAAASSVYNSGGNSQTIKADTRITVNVPSGTPVLQAEAISRQVDQAVRDSLASAISGSRGSIPSPEARRN